LAHQSQLHDNLKTTLQYLFLTYSVPVTMNMFINDKHNGNQFTEIRKEIFKECAPIIALITLACFARIGLLLEIQGVVVIGDR
jgi:hypothetical protein